MFPSENDAESWACLPPFVGSTPVSKTLKLSWPTTETLLFPAGVSQDCQAFTVKRRLEFPARRKLQGTADYKFSVAFSRTLQQYPLSRVQLTEARSLLKGYAAAGGREFCPLRPHTSFEKHRLPLHSLCRACTRSVNTSSLDWNTLITVRFRFILRQGRPTNEADWSATQADLLATGIPSKQSKRCFIRWRIATGTGLVLAEEHLPPAPTQRSATVTRGRFACHAESFDASW